MLNPSPTVDDAPTPPPADHRSARHATVCQVLHSLTIGGAEVLAANLARRLSDRYRFVFACLDDLGPLGEQLRSEGFLVEVLGRKEGFDVRCVRRLAQFARSHHVDVIHAHQYTPFFYARAPGVFAQRPPVLFNEHGRFHPDYPRRKRMLFNRLALRSGDRVAAVGESVRQALINNEGIPAERIEVIYNGVNLDKFTATEEVRESVRRELGLAAGDFVVMQVARLDPIKDHLTALRAIERVAKTCPQARLVIVGDGPQRQLIETEITRRHLTSHVRMLGQRTDVPRILPAADAFLLTSVSEGIPVTMIEAMGARLPIVSTNVGGIAEVVIEQTTGLLGAAGDDAAIADALVQLIQQPETCHRLGQAGYNRAHQQFSEPQMHARYAQLYDEMLRQAVRR